MIANTYVVPLDGSPFAERAIPVAAALAERVDGRLVLLSAPHNGPLDPKEYLARSRDALHRRDGRHDLRRRRPPGRRDCVRRGRVRRPRCLHDEPWSQRPALVGARQRGRGGCPAQRSTRAARRAALPRRLPRARHAHARRSRHRGPRDVTSPRSRGSGRSGSVCRWTRRLSCTRSTSRARSIADPLLAPIVAEFGGADQVRATMLSSTYVAGAVADYAGDLPAALIAMNTAARTGLARVTLGSVTMGVLHLSDCPLLVIHDNDAP